MELTNVEKKAYKLMMDGKTPKDISGIMSFNRSRGRRVCSSIYSKAGVSNQPQLMAMEIKKLSKKSN